MVTTRRASRALLDDAAETERPEKKAKTENHVDNHQKVPGPNQGRVKNAREPTKDEYPPRVSSLWKVGAHVSSAGGIENSVQNAAAIGANGFALFLKSQRKWISPPFKDTSVSTFKMRLKEFGYSPSHILPHGSYLINLGNPDDEKRQKSYDCFLDDLQRCEQLGLELYNFHPGSTVGAVTSDVSISFIAECINRAHKATKSVIIVVENMAGAGNIIGSVFTELAEIIHHVEDKSRIGVCLDTCHMFAAGYDIRTKDGWLKTIADFDSEVGLSYLRGMHLNDSKTELNSKRDRHENIGLGHIGLPAFHHIVTDPRMQNIPLVLETPSFEKPEVWSKEVEVLNRLSKLDGEMEKLEWESMVGEIKDIVRDAGGSAPAISGKTPKRRRKDIETDDQTEVETMS